MRLRVWQRAEIDGELFRLRMKYRDPLTGDIDEGQKSDFDEEWMAWVKTRDYAQSVAFRALASEWKRDNVERLQLRIRDKDKPEEPERLVYDAQCILPLTLDGSVTALAEDATRRHFQEHLAAYQTTLDRHIQRGTRYVQAVRNEMWRFQTENEHWRDVQGRGENGAP